MSEPQASRSLGRSIGALLLGAFVAIILSIGTDAAMHATGVFPSLGQPMASSLFLVATVYRSAYGVLSSYVTARFAPNRPMGHALVGGVLGLVAATVGAVATWNRGPALGPHWYPISLMVTALPCAWVGGKLRANQLRGTPAGS